MSVILRRADAELVALYTSTTCLGAQHYDPRAGVSGDAHEHVLNQIAARAHRPPARAAATLADLPPATRNVLDLVYGRGAGTFERGTKELALDVDLLVRALAPRWGHGTFLWIVGRVPRAVRAFERRRREGESVLDFLRREAQPERAKETRGFFGQLVLECEEIRTPALSAYAMAKRERFGRERDARTPRISRVDYIERLATGRAA